MENSSRFFENRACQFFPCHKLDGDFNCLFCYCPLYDKNPCPGKPTFIKKDDGRIIKRCTDCVFPHKAENYDKIMSILRVKKDSFSDDFGDFHHGGELYGLSEKKRADILDFSVNTNPLGMPEKVKEALREHFSDFEKYPDQNCGLLKVNLAEKYKTCLGLSLPTDFITIGNGASQLISLAVRAISPKKSLLLAPTFSGYERALKSCDCQICYHDLARNSGFSLEDDIFSSINKFQPDMLFLCNPNNPVGKMAEKKLIEKIIYFCEEKGIFTLVDECFIEFTGKSHESAVRLVKDCPHLIVLNAFTKIYSMAGIRLGHIISSNVALLKKIFFLQPEWSVSSVAQIAGLAALTEYDFIQQTQRFIKSEREFLSAELKKMVKEVYQSDSNFILFNSMSENIDTFLLKKDILIRNCGNFRNLTKNDYRIAVRTHEENIRLLKTLHIASL
ncbi:MAG: aminotransferase class I/II-fold pyridoxal phosphate-dependent enzyme [Treponema sp.]|nr:aminotransferase class I/II-fold pyridoxal phosphate-dependent enzyme [Treponema sp.]